MAIFTKATDKECINDYDFYDYSLIGSDYSNYSCIHAFDRH